MDAADRSDHASARPRLQDYLILWRTPSFILKTLGMTALTFAIGGIGFWMPRYIHIYRGQPDLGLGNTIFGGILVVAGLTATLLGGTARCGRGERVDRGLKEVLPQFR